MAQGQSAQEAQALIRRGKQDALQPLPEVLGMAVTHDHKQEDWHRRKDESIAHYRLFKYYCHMLDHPHPSRFTVSIGTKVRFRRRSIARVIQHFRMAPMLIYEIAKEYEWERRVKSYDDHMITVEQEMVEQSHLAANHMWLQRQAELREKEWSAAEKLLQRAFEMLEWPMVREIIEMKEEVTPAGLLMKQYLVREPADWSPGDIARFFELASKLARLAAGMDTSRSKLKVDLSSMDDDELQRVAAGELP